MCIKFINYTANEIRTLGLKKCAGLPRAVKRKIFIYKICNKEHTCDMEHAYRIPTRISCNRPSTKTRNNTSHRYDHQPRVLRCLPRCDRHLFQRSKKLSFGLYNIRSLNNKVEDLLHVIDEHQVDILMMVETWHDPDSASINRLRAAGFNVIDRARPRIRDDTTNVNHGGVAIVSQSGLRLTRLSCGFDPISFECVISRSTFQSASCTIVLIYRTGHVTSSFFAELTQLLDYFATSGDTILVTGDFNIHFELSADRCANQLNDIFSSYGFTCMVNQPTHDQGGIIDLIFTRNESLFSSVRHFDPGLSDHHFLSWSSALKRHLPLYKSFTYRPWKFLNIIDLRTIISESVLCCPSEYMCLDTDQLVECFRRVLEAALDHLVPLSSVRIRRRESDAWYDQECRFAKRLLRRIERYVVASNTTEDLQIMWQSSKTYYRNILKCKREVYWCNKINTESGNSKQMWSSVKTLLGRGKPSSGSDLHAEEFQRYFSEKVESVQLLTGDCEATTFPSIGNDVCFTDFEAVSPSHITSVILSMPNKQSSRDLLPMKFMKECIDLLSPFLAVLVNSSITNGHFPVDLATSCVIPILKKSCGDSDQLGSYRPIHNLPILSKLIERIVHKQLNTYLTSGEMLSSVQSAYRPYHSTETVLIRISSDVLTAMDHGLVTLFSSLDLSSAFDCVRHDILLDRLRLSYGLYGMVLKWFHSYINNRFQYFQSGDTISPVSTVTCGVPQGSVLGPVLFSLYIMDIIQLVQSFNLKVHAFADDIQIYGSCCQNEVSLLTQTMSNCICAVRNWLSSNGLYLNARKTNMMWISTRQRLGDFSDRPIIIGDDCVHPVSQLRCLGVTLDSTWSFKHHVTRTVASSFGTLRQLRLVRRSITRSLFSTLVTSLVFPKLDYCSSILAGIPEEQISRLQRVINAAARLVYGLPKFSHVTPVLNELKWLSMRSRIDLRIATMTYKCLNGCAPSYLRELVVPVSSFHNRTRLRSSARNMLHLPKHRLKTVTKKHFSSISAHLWNKLPSTVLSSSSIRIFKCSTKTFLMTD